MTYLFVPAGKLATTPAEDAAAKKRREIREKLLRGERLVVTQNGEVKEKAGPNEAAIVVPPGKLATSFYWYENDIELYNLEVEAMTKHYPQFSITKLSDGKMAWHGILQPSNIKPGAVWHLQAAYENNHPNNSTYGGSIKVYAISPDLEEVQRELGSAIPHTLTDSSRHLYLCTSRKEDFHASVSHSTSAASALAWAAKWIAAFELWMAGDITTQQFQGHQI